ncbi:MAG: hypothetical protein Q7R70_03015 [Candidatus Diapherotrites archaeon]|nr:hypothetical protein [Candidatus Diapherotrites archaeon]
MKLCFLFFVALLFAGFAFSAIAPSNYLIERVSGGSYPPVSQHLIFPEPSGILPAKGVSWIHAQTGNRTARVTDAFADDNALNPSYYNPTWPGTGFYNGYSTYTNVNITGEYAVVFATTALSNLYRLSDNARLNRIKTKQATAGNNIGEVHGIRWDLTGIPGTQTIIYYNIGSKLYQQDVLLGSASEQIVFTFPGQLGEDTYGDFSTDGKYRAFVMADNNAPSGISIIVFDKLNKRILPGKITTHLGVTSMVKTGADVSPDGKWLYVTGSVYTYYDGTPGSIGGARYYRISDLEAGMTEPIRWLNYVGSHSGWNYDYNGKLVKIVRASTGNSADWYFAEYPETGEKMKIMHMTELGGWNTDQHIARMYNPSMKGWALFSTYNCLTEYNTWGSQQLFMVEIKPAQINGVKVPADQMPRIWRLGQTYAQTNADSDASCNKQYFAEAFANLDPSGTKVFWGGNWMFSGNLEMYELELPENWHQNLSGIIPPPACTLPQISCNGSCIAPVCSSNSQCDDSNSSTTDSCNNAGTCTAFCSRIPIPQQSGKVYNLYAGTPDVSSYSIGPDGVCVQGLYWGKDTLSNTTRGNYFGAVSIRKGTWTYFNGTTTITSSFDSVWANSYHHGSIVFRFNIPAELTGKKIKSAYFGFNANNPSGASDGGSIPKGREMVPIKTILNPQGYADPPTCAYLKDINGGTVESNWNGASFLNRYEVPNGSGGYNSTPWSTLPTKLIVDGKTYGKIGDITSVEGPIAGWISFVSNAMSYSTDVTPAIQAIVDGAQNNGFFMDVDNLSSPDNFGDYSNTLNPKFTSHVIFYSSFAADPATRPRLVITLNENPQVNCTLPQISCSGVCIVPVCSVNAHCDDLNSLTVDICNNVGTCNANCTHAVIAACFDLTGDKKVNLFDLVFVALRIGNGTGDPADVLGNNGVNISDLQAVSMNFGQTC